MDIFTPDFGTSRCGQLISSMAMANGGLSACRSQSRKDRGNQMLAKILVHQVDFIGIFSSTWCPRWKRQ